MNLSAGVVIGVCPSEFAGRSDSKVRMDSRSDADQRQTKFAFRRASRLILTRLVRPSLMLRFPLRRTRHFIRLRARQRMSRRRDRLPYAVKHRPRLALRLRWRTSSSHISASTHLLISGTAAMLAPHASRCQRIHLGVRRGSTTESFANFTVCRVTLD